MPRYVNVEAQNSTAERLSRPAKSPRPKGKNAAWAAPPELEKARHKVDKEMREAEKARDTRYLGEPTTQEEFAGTGYYLWPKLISSGIDDDENASNHPRDVFGSNLEKLDYIRFNRRVWITWDEKKSSLKVLSLKTQSDLYITDAIKDIRQAVRYANAEAQFASPLYIIDPPDGKDMGSYVKIKSTRAGKSQAVPIITSVTMSESGLSEKEQQLWDTKCVKMREENITRFKEHLAKHTLRLASFRGWMRMRLHFGHVNIKDYRTEFGNPEFSFEKFVAMMSNSRATSTCVFDRKMDGPTVKILLSNIIANSTVFSPKESRVIRLEDVAPKHTLVLFAQAGGQQFRVEAAIECVSDLGTSGGWDDHGILPVKDPRYQIGSMKGFYENNRNKRAQVTVLDIKRGVDWTMEIIADGTFPNIPASMVTFIERCVTSETSDREDSLGLLYPDIAPISTYGITVHDTIVRSVYEFEYTEWGYIIEISIYRRWDGISTKQVSYSEGCCHAKDQPLQAICRCAKDSQLELNCGCFRDFIDNQKQYNENGQFQPECRCLTKHSQSKIKCNCLRLFLKNGKVRPQCFTKSIVKMEPTIEASVSMYHRVWDEQTSSIENTTLERQWDRDLKCFFEQQYQNGGFDEFLKRVIGIQNQISNASKLAADNGAAAVKAMRDE